MNPDKLKNIVESALLVAGHPLTMEILLSLFDDETDGKPGRDDIRTAIAQLEVDFESRGVEIKQVASGYRIQVKQEYSDWMSRLWNEKPSRYSRALLETLALIAYRQPTTRAEIEDVRGVAVSSNIIRTLVEREWIRVVGHRDVPGKPAMFGTTKLFLDYFNLKSLSDLPTLADIRDIDEITGDLFKEDAEKETDGIEDAEASEDNVISIEVAQTDDDNAEISEDSVIEDEISEDALQEDDELEDDISVTSGDSIADSDPNSEATSQQDDEVEEENSDDDSQEVNRHAEHIQSSSLHHEQNDTLESSESVELAKDKEELPA